MTISVNRPTGGAQAVPHNGRARPEWKTATARNGYQRNVDIGEQSLRKIVSRSSVMEDVRQTVRQSASVDCTVLVTGPSGTGKELVAEAIHSNSPRVNGPFVTINMAAVPESLVESELFGHVKGAFTGSSTDRIGRFEAAEGGTIFIDEIGDLQLPSQAKLLRVLESHAVTPVGGNEERSVDVRVVAATNHCLEHRIATGKFRDDLYYRLNIVRVSLPPLRERCDDIPMLVQHFVEHFCEMYLRPPVTFDDELMDFLRSHSWPGNVRELRNCVESMVVLANSARLTIDDVPPMVRRGVPLSGAAFDMPENTTLAELEKAAVLQTLDRCDGNRTLTARKLDISIRTLQRKLARWQKGASD